MRVHVIGLMAGNQMGIVGNPKDLNERIVLATQCVSQYKFTIPIVIHGMGGTEQRTVWTRGKQI